MLRYTFLLLLPTVTAVCRVPPEFWCSSFKNMQECDVLEQCANYLGNTEASPVVLDLYYESLCPFCKQFISQQLAPTWALLEKTGILEVNLIPYGNAREVKNGTGYDYTCQHGPEECYGNLLETCAINMTTGFSDVFPFIHCVESSKSVPREVAHKCADSTAMNYEALINCMNSANGNALQHQMALRTQKAGSHYAPWIVVNGEHNTEEQNAAQENLLKYVCQLYKGPKPSACKELEQGLGRC